MISMRLKGLSIIKALLLPKKKTRTKTRTKMLSFQYHWHSSCSSCTQGLQATCRPTVTESCSGLHKLTLMQSVNFNRIVNTALTHKF